MHPESSDHAHVPGESAGQDAQDVTRPDIPPPGRPPSGEEQGVSHGDRPPGAFHRGRAGFRAWRRSRPFWGGLLLIFAGAEILVLPLMGLLTHSAFKVVIYIGIGGVFGIIFGCVLVACGLLAWFHPVQRVFYAVVGVLLALGSFVVTNLGGFFLGMLLGVIGASLVFGWTPVAPEDRGRHRTRRAPAPSDGLDAVLGGSGGGPGPGGGSPPPAGPQPQVPPGPDRAAGGDPGRPPGSGSWHTGAGGAALLALPIAPMLILSGVLAGGQAPVPAPATASPAVTASPPVSPSPATSPSPSGSGSPSPSPSPSATGPSPSGSGSPTPSPSPSVNPNAGKRASAASALVAASSPATLTAGSAVMAGLSYDGVATVPTANGSQQMLKFSMNSLTLSGVVLTVGGSGHSMVTRNSSVHFSGNVVLYATKLSGDLLGVPLSFSPASPPLLVLPLMQFSNVVTDQPLTSADSMQAAGLDITSS